MHKILQQLLNRTFTYYHQISCKTEGDIKRKLLYSHYHCNLPIDIIDFEAIGTPAVFMSIPELKCLVPFTID